MDDPRQILAAAGVECAEVAQLQKAIDLINALPPADDFASEITIASMLTHLNELRDAAILALARIVAQYKWQRDRCAAWLWDNSDHRTEEACIADAVNELDRLWKEHNEGGHHE